LTERHRPAAGSTTHHRRVPLALATVALVVLVLVVVVALVVVRLVSGSSGTALPTTPPASATVQAEVTGVPGRALAAVAAPGPPAVTPPTTTAADVTLRDGRRPLVVYVGAEFCPFCAAERWPLVVALSRFGTFGHLGISVSSDQLVFPRTPSLSFRNATYHSRWVAFDPIETYSASGTHLDPTAFAQLAEVPRTVLRLLDRQDAPPSAPVRGTLPFVDLAGRFEVIGAAFSPGVLDGLSVAQVAADLATPTDPVAMAIDGAANELTAAICQTTGQRPAAVCHSAAVAAGAARLGPAPTRR
jgi:hypothetical protein